MTLTVYKTLEQLNDDLGFVISEYATDLVGMQIRTDIREAGLSKTLFTNLNGDWLYQDTEEVKRIVSKRIRY